MKLIKLVKAVFAAALVAGSLSAQAEAVSCGNSTLGIRVATVDPALVNGYCYAQAGNLKDADITGLGLTLIEKDVTSKNTGLIGDLMYTINNISGQESGTWAFSSNLWNTWERLFIGFHFGNGTTEALQSPDSFILELMSPDASGTWQLEGEAAKLTGLSNIYLIGKGAANQVPEPGMLALLALGLLAAGTAHRGRRA